MQNPQVTITLQSGNKIVIELYPEIKYEDVRSTHLMLFNLSKSEYIGLAPKIILTRELQTNEFIELESNVVVPKAKMYASYIKRLSNKKIQAVINFFKENNYYKLLEEKKDINN